MFSRLLLVVILKLHYWVLLNCALTSNQLHPPPPRSTQLYQTPPSSTQLILVCTHPSHVTAQFPHFGLRTQKLSVLPENWYIWYLGGVDSESGLNSTFRQICAEKVKVARFTRAKKLGPKKHSLFMLI